MINRLICATLSVLSLQYGWSARVFAQQPPPADVVVLALESSETSDFLTFQRLLQTTSGLPATRTLINIQMDIVRKTLPFGPVLLVAPDAATESALLSNCDSYDLCAALADGRVRIGVVPHDSPWIRDYGPFIESSPMGPRVVDADYDNERDDAALTDALRRASKNRDDALKHIRKLLDGAEDPLDKVLRGSQANAGTELESFQRELAYWREYADVVRDRATYNRRKLDARAPFGVAKILFADRPFAYEATPLFVDGGNMMKLDDGTCLTTHGVYQHNPTTQNTVLPEVARVFQCNEVVLLGSLPGPNVIDHVDMFVMPAGGKKLVLPDYGLTQKHLVKAWPGLDDVIRDLITQAAIVMAKNVEILRSHGFDVVLVPGLPPRTTDDGSVYYPTSMNALVRSNGTERQVLVPRYAGYYEETQDEALKAIRTEFGSNTQVETIESTAAAEGQGAIHCLTITVPMAPSVFARTDGEQVRTTLEQRRALEQGRDQLKNPSLTGTWRVRRVGTTGTEGTGLDIQLAFDEKRIKIQFDTRTVSGTYTRLQETGGTAESSSRWPLEIVFDKSEDSKLHARIDWITNRQATLILEDGDTLRLTKSPTLTDLPTNERKIAPVAKEAGELTDADERDELGARMQAWTYNATAGDQISFFASSEAFAPELMVVGPGLERPLSGESMKLLQMAVLTTVFPESGIYKIVVKATSSRESGEFTLSAERKEPVAPWSSEEILGFLEEAPTKKASLRIGSRVTGMITRDTSEAPNGSRLEAFTLAKCDGERIHISVKSKDMDAVLVVLGSDKKTPRFNDDDESEDTTDSALEFDCEKAVTYKVFAGSLTGEGGAYEIRLEKVSKR